MDGCAYCVKAAPPPAFQSKSRKNGISAYSSVGPQHRKSRVSQKKTPQRNNADNKTTLELRTHVTKHKFHLWYFSVFGFSHVVRMRLTDDVSKLSAGSIFPSERTVITILSLDLWRWNRLRVPKRCQPTSSTRRVKIQQERQCTHNVALRAVHETIVAMENKSYIFLCVCACVRMALLIQHATRRHIAICSLSGSRLFTLSHKWNDFRKRVIEHKMCILIFSRTFIRNISHSKKNSARYYHKCRNVFMQNIRYSCRI